MKWIFLLSLVSHAAWAAEPVCAKSYITLRKAPGNNEAVSWKVARYMPFLRLEKKNGWSKLEDLEGEIHFAKNSDVTNQFRCVVVKTTVATLRAQPNSSAPPIELKTADRYTPFKRLNNDRDWMQIEDETGRQAWIHETQVWKPVNIQSFTF